MKDLRQEARTRESFTAAFFFALLVQVIFSFAFDFQRLGLGFEDVGAGALWITLTFSAVLSLQNSFLIKREKSCLTALALSPCEPSSDFLGKFLANLVVVLIVQGPILPISAVFFSDDFAGAWLPLALVIAVTAAGCAALGTLFAAVSVRTRRSELMLPLLLLPAATPVILWGVKATRLCLAGRALASYGTLLGLSACFAAVFLAAGVLVFDHVLEE